MGWQTVGIVAVVLVWVLGPVGTIGGKALQASELTAEQNARNRVNFAGRQRMLTQKIARDACFVMADIDPERFAAKADATVRQFSTTLEGLRNGSALLGLFPETDADVLDRLDDVQVLWRTLEPASRQIAAGDLHSVPMAQLIRLNVETLLAMQVAVDATIKVYDADTESSDVAMTIALAGRQRMLSQKVSKEVCFYMLGLTRAASPEQIAETVAEFDTAMAALMNGDAAAGIIAPPDRQVKRQLDRTSKAWNAFKKLLAALRHRQELNAGEKIQLANLSDQVLLEMDLAVSLYTSH